MQDLLIRRYTLELIGANPRSLTVDLDVNYMLYGVAGR